MTARSQRLGQAQSKSQSGLIAHQAVIDGHTVLFTSAGQLLGDLCALDSDSTLQRRLRHYARPQLLVIDDVGYLSYSNRHVDMLFQLVSRRYQNKSTLITTNRPFGEWNEVFPNAACATMPDRSCSSLMRSAIYPIPTVTPTCCSNSSRVDIRTKAR